MCNVELDPVFAMAESISLDGGSRLDDRNQPSLPLTLVSEQRPVAHRRPPVPDVGRCRRRSPLAARALR